MNIDTDSYNGSIDGKTAAHYSTDKADLWLLPVGISISHESVYCRRLESASDSRYRLCLDFR